MEFDGWLVLDLTNNGKIQQVTYHDGSHNVTRPKTFCNLDLVLLRSPDVLLSDQALKLIFADTSAVTFPNDENGKIGLPGIDSGYTSKHRGVNSWQSVDAWGIDGIHTPGTGIIDYAYSVGRLGHTPSDGGANVAIIKVGARPMTDPFGGG